MCSCVLGSWCKGRWAPEHPQLPPNHAWGRLILATRWHHNTTLLYSLCTQVVILRREQSLVQSNIFSLLFLHMCQLAVQTEVVLFTVEWGITTKSLKAISNSVITIFPAYHVMYKHILFFFKCMLCPFLLQPLENIKTKRICLHFSGIYKEIFINQENLHVGLGLSCRMTTSWMCCSCWWLWCLNILVPWSRLLTSATGFGKHGCIILALVSIVFFRFTTYFFKSVISSFQTVLSCIWGLNVSSSW